MLRQAVRAGLKQPPFAAGGGVRTAVSRTFAAPIGGWNARDPLAAMGKADAVTLENWFPRVADCAIRGGCSNHVTGFAQRPKTLMQHAGRGGTSKMYAATDTGIYDTTTAGALGALLIGRTNGYHNWCQMGVSGANYLIAPNGVDKPAYYDGATWIAVDAASVPALTGVATTSLISACAYKRRLFFLERDKLNFWYLPADAVGGALLEFQLGPLCNRGGYAMAMLNWSLDAGNGPDDRMVFITSEGEAIVFSGTNPADATNWSLVGVYFVGKPLGRKCLRKMGGDIIVLTDLGAFPLSTATLSADIDRTKALSNKVEGAFLDAGRIYGANTGFMMEILPTRGAFIVNIPTSDGGASAVQYVMNTTTKSWCKFSGWNASDFIVFNKELYFCDATKVAKAWTSTFSDYGANIVAYGQTSFQNFGSAQTKDWKMWRPLLRTNGALSYNQGIAVDFEANPMLAPATYTAFGGARWDVDFWDVGLWAAGLETSLEWQTPGAKPGVWAAGLLTVATNLLEVQWAASEYLYEVGSIAT